MAVLKMQVQVPVPAFPFMRQYDSLSRNPSRKCYSVIPILISQCFAADSASVQ